MTRTRIWLCLLLPALIYTTAGALLKSAGLEDAAIALVRLALSAGMFAMVKRTRTDPSASPSSVDSENTSNVNARASEIPAASPVSIARIMLFFTAHVAHALQGLLCGLVLGALIRVGVRLIFEIPSAAPEWAQGIRGIAVLCAVVPLSEELLYRGIVQVRAMTTMNLAAAIVIAAALFAAGHHALERMLPALIAGLVFGVLYAKRGLACTIVAHAASNLSALLPEGTALWVGAAAAVLSAGNLILTRIHRTKETQIP